MTCCSWSPAEGPGGWRWGCCERPSVRLWGSAGSGGLLCVVSWRKSCLRHCDREVLCETEQSVRLEAVWG